jgi:hypothetical protein
MTIDTQTSPLLVPLSEFAPRHSLPDYSRFRDPVFIHCCKDGTFSTRRPNEKIFNGVALPVYVVPSMEHAIQLQVLMCFSVHAVHPAMKRGEPWYKFNDIRQSPHQSKSLPPWEGMEIPVFEVDDLPKLTAKIHACYRVHVGPLMRKKKNRQRAQAGATR